MSSRDCQADALHLVLADQSEHPDYAGVVEHLDDCETCRTRLDGLVASPQWWDDTRTILSQPTESIPPAPDPGHTLIVPQVSGVTADPDPSLFLDPPRHPEMLGRVGKYEVERELGRGGMGIVLRGFDSELNRPVAIKVLAPHLASSGTARQRFVREARAAAAVVHDNVVAIHGIEAVGNLPAIVMPLIRGNSLQEHVDQHGALDVIDIVQIARQVAAGLAAAHAQGLVHRDIKPANVLLENDLNRVQITDFGLARAAHDMNLTHSGVITGTPHFMSPEQALGEGVDHRADLFSLGAVMYHMATGRLPFAAGTTMGVLQQVCHETPLRIRELNPEIPQQLETLIEKLLEKNRDDRFETAAELEAYLADYLAHLQQPTARKAPRKLTTAASRTRIRLRVARWGMAVVVLGGLAAVTAVAYSRWLEPEPNTVTGPALARTFADLNVATDDAMERDMRELAAAIAGLETTSASPAVAGQSATAYLARAIGQLETPRSAGWASNFDKEVQSIDAELRRLERSERADFFSAQ